MKPILLVIDIQHWFFRTEERRDGIPKLIQGTNELIEYFDKRDFPVLHILTVHKENKSTWPLGMLKDNTAVLIEGTEGAKELKEVINDSKHTTLIKTRHSAFIRTNLEVHLREKNIDTVVLAGVFNHGCIFMTAADAYERDFNVIISKDATFSHRLNWADVLLDIAQQEYGAEYITNRDIIEKLRA